MSQPATRVDHLERWDHESVLRELENLDLPDCDGEPLESEWHRMEINLLVEMVRNHFASRTDYYAGGNMFIHFSAEHARNRDFRGPDFLFVWNRPLEPARRYWAVWQEAGRYPDVIIELISATTEKADRTTKFTVYEQTFKTAEYFIFDPFSNTLDGYRLGPTLRYQPLVADERGRMWSEQLGLFLGTWQGVFQRYDMTWLRFFKTEGSVVPTTMEIAMSERQRAEAAEAELRQLREQLARSNPPANGS